MTDKHIAYTAIRRDGETYPVYCGTYDSDGEVLCDEHEAEMKARYPQGWQHYPGDVCVHGRYVGGSGIDWMCQYCENGETYWVDAPKYQLMFALLDGPPQDFIRLNPWYDDGRDVAWERIEKFMNEPVWQHADTLALNPTWHVLVVSKGYWSDKPQPGNQLVTP